MLADRPHATLKADLSLPGWVIRCKRLFGRLNLRSCPRAEEDADQGIRGPIFVRPFDAMEPQRGLLLAMPRQIRLAEYAGR